MNARHEIAISAARKIEAAIPSLSSLGVVVGYDGFVDEIIHLVDKRYQLDHFDRVPTIRALADKIAAASGESSNIEMVVAKDEHGKPMIKLGGNGPIMANAMAAAGFGVTYFGCLGYPTLHPVFQEMADRATVHSFAEPGHTDALEFTDGKLMMGKLETINEVTWENLKARVGLDAMKAACETASLLCANNWTMVPYMETIWEGLLTEVLPHVPQAHRIFFFDLADPEKRTKASLRKALETIGKFGQYGTVVLGVNLKESHQVLEVLELEAAPSTPDGLKANAAAIRQALGLGCVVIHPRTGAAAATESETGYFAGPFVQDPKISTGAGDHFNAGFCLGQVLRLTIEESLAAGTATSGYYVLGYGSPSAAHLVAFLNDLPEPQAAE